MQRFFFYTVLIMHTNSSLEYKRLTAKNLEVVRAKVFHAGLAVNAFVLHYLNTVASFVS